jgi:hypothetical protein
VATPTNTLLDKTATLLAADATTLAAATALKIHLAMASFTPSATLVIANVTEATFTGYAALNAGIGTQQEFVDPVTGNRIIQILDPAGGLHWATTGATGLPMTIYGWYLTDNGNTTIYMSSLLPGGPVTLTASGQGIDVPTVRIGLLPGAWV